jgi:hypothetical protein
MQKLFHKEGGIFADNSEALPKRLPVIVDVLFASELSKASLLDPDSCIAGAAVTSSTYAVRQKDYGALHLAPYGLRSNQTSRAYQKMTAIQLIIFQQQSQ